MIMRACVAVLLLTLPVSVASAEQRNPLDIGSRLELFVDDFVIDSMTGASLRFHKPTPRNAAIVFDAPWEGNMTGYHTVFQDGDLYRMYYKAEQLNLAPGKLTSTHPFFTCYAESHDGIHWTKPLLGLYAFNGAKNNNIIWSGPASHAFAPFKDLNPKCTPEAKYKAVAYDESDGKLYAMKSPDAIHWSRLQEKPIFTEGRFDSLNLAFWDVSRGQYRAYMRDWPNGLRGIRTATSDDFVRWSNATTLQYPEYPRASIEELYTAGIVPYYREPHLFLGFPTRYLDRGWSPSMEDLPDVAHRRLRASTGDPRYGTALTEGLFMSSRDGQSFHRWGEAFIRPGPGTNNWTYGDNFASWGVVETRSNTPGAPNELSLYANENYWKGTGCQLRRFTVRIDGFVSVEAPMRGGELVTKPLLFRGSQLAINFSTSAAGGVQIAVLDAKGTPLAGYESGEMFGDSVSRTVRWTGKPDVAALAGKPIRLKVTLRDADLFSFQFR
jgi:hypothetical protein